MKKHLLRFNEQGFTLVELIVALIITGLITGVILNFMLSNLVQSSSQTARAALLNEAQIALNIADNDIQSSASADQNNRWQDANAPDPTNQLSWQSNSSTLILATAAQDTSGNIIFADPLKYITQKNNDIYFVQNNTLYKRILAAPVSGNSAKTTCPANLATSTCPADKALIHNVSSFSVRYLDATNQDVTPSNARSIELTLNLATKQYGQTLSASYTTRMVFRND